MMKTMNKVIAAMMMMTITTAMPAMAGHKKYNNGKYDRAVVVVDKKVSHFDTPRNAYRPNVKACTFRVSRHDAHRTVVARAARMRGVIDTKWNPRTRELTILYDARVTSAHHILHSVA